MPPTRLFEVGAELAHINQPGHVGLTPIVRQRSLNAPSEDRPCSLRSGEERADLHGRGNEDRPCEDRVFAAAQGRRRLLLRHLRCQRQHGRARSGPADPSRLDAGCGARDRAGISRCRARRRVHPQRSVSRRLAPSRRERRGTCLPRRPPARLRMRARALARHRQRHARQLRRGDRNLRRGPATAADPPVSRRQAGPRDRGDHLRQCPHPHRTARRSARAGGGKLACRGAAAGARGEIRHRHAARHHAGGAGLLGNDDARRAARAARRRGGIHRYLRRRRHHRAGRDRRRDLHGEAAHHQARRHDHRGLHRLRSAGGRTDECAAHRHRIRRVLRAEDDRRSEEPDPAQFRLLASGDGDARRLARW